MPLHQNTGGKALREDLKSILMTVLSTLVLIVVGIIYFAITLAIIDVSAWVLLGANLDENWAVLSAAIITLGSMLGGSLRQRPVLMMNQ
jgi:hypothetical protein